MSLKKWFSLLIFVVIFFGSILYFRLDEYEAVRSFIRSYGLFILIVSFPVVYYLGLKTLYDQNHPNKPM